MGMSEEEKLKQQLTFIDYIYPKLSQRIDDMDKQFNALHRKVQGFKLEREYLIDHFLQYKKKIQRIEQFLIENGLIRLLGKKCD